MKLLSTSFFILIFSSFFNNVNAQNDEDYQPYQLSKCFKNSLTPVDRQYLANWLYASYASNPKLQNLANITPSQKQDADKNMGQLITRLVTINCPNEVKQTIKNEGENGLEKPSEIVGEIAAFELISHPKVIKAMGDFADYTNKEKIRTIIPNYH